MSLKKYQTKQIKRYQSGKILFMGLNSKKIWLILSTPNITALKKQLLKNNVVNKQIYLINNYKKKFFETKIINSFIKTIAIQLESLEQCGPLIDLLKKKTNSVPKYFFYNKSIYDYTFFCNCQKKKDIKNLFLPIKIKNFNTKILFNLFKTITYNKC
jgi:hypothetical protein